MEDTIPAQVIDERGRTYYARQRFREWVLDSLLFYPFLFMVVAIIGAYITRSIDTYLTSQGAIPHWLAANASVGITLTSLIASSMLAFLATVFSVSLIALQLANQQYSPRVLSTFERSSITKITLSLFIATFVYSFMLLAWVLRRPNEQVSIISLGTDFMLVFACLITFILFMKTILITIRVSHIISIIAEDTRQAIAANLPPEEAYVACSVPSLGEPHQVISYVRPPSTLFYRGHDHGAFKAVERSTLVQIASEHDCVLRVLPHYSDYINEEDPVVEVYGKVMISPRQVLKALYVAPEPSVAQDPAYGIRMLVDIALQAISPAVNAPTTAHQVILRLTNLLTTISRRPPCTGAYADERGQVRLLLPQVTWEDYVGLAFREICHYGKEDPQTRHAVSEALDYLLKKAPEVCRPAVQDVKELLGNGSLAQPA